MWCWYVLELVRATIASEYLIVLELELGCSTLWQTRAFTRSTFHDDKTILYAETRGKQEARLFVSSPAVSMNDHMGSRRVQHALTYLWYNEC